MPTFIKTGYWESAVKSYKGWLNLNDLFIENSGSVSPGQVAFYNSNNSITGSNNLFWNNVNGRLGINNPTPLFSLDVTGTAKISGLTIVSPISTINTYNAFSTFNIVNDGPASAAIDRFSNNGTSPHFNLRKSRGTSVIPAIVQTNDELGYVGFWGHDGTSFQRNGIILVQAENVTGTTITPVMRFGVGTNATSNQYGITLTSNWNTVLGNFGTDTGEKLQVIGNAKITGSLDLFSVTSAGAGSDYFYLDNDPNLSAGANNQTIALMRLRDRGSNGAFTGVNRFGILMENASGGNFPFQLFSDTGNLRIGYSTVASTTTRLSLRGGTNDNSARTLDIENAAGNPVLRVYNGVQVLVGSSTPAASTILQADSTTQGFLPPRMTTAQKNAIASPPAGLIVYDTGLNKLCVFTTAWQTITSA
jgi:hypothetical protein